MNHNRVLVEVLEEPQPSRIILPGPKSKQPQLIKAKVLKIGSQVTTVKIGQTVTLHNEGIKWSESQAKCRIVNETSILTNEKK